MSGHATYGYSSGGGSVSYPWYPYYGDPYGYGWGWSGWWGAPWYSMGVWWPPAAYYGAQPEILNVGGSRNATPAVLETDVRPRKSIVRVDGEEVGRAKDYNGSWDRLPVAPGQHVLELAAPGFMTLRTVVRLEPGRLYRIEQDQRAGEGIDPRSESAPVNDPTARTETNSPDVSALATLRRGFLKIAADPPDAAVYLDGEFLASARELDALHGSIPVAVGEHEVEVTHPKFKSRSLRVSVSGSDPVHVDLRVGD